MVEARLLVKEGAEAEVPRKTTSNIIYLPQETLPLSPSDPST